MVDPSILTSARRHWIASSVNQLYHWLVIQVLLLRDVFGFPDSLGYLAINVCHFPLPSAQVILPVSFLAVAFDPQTWLHGHSSSFQAISHYKFCHPLSYRYLCLFECCFSTPPHIPNGQAISSFQNRVSHRFSTFHCIFSHPVPLFAPCLHAYHCSIGRWTSFHLAKSSRLCRSAFRWPKSLCTYFYLPRHRSHNRCAYFTPTRLHNRHLMAISLLHGLDAR